jgi:long-chain acyl-CoA synthetase
MDQAATVSAVLRERLAVLGEAPYVEFERGWVPGRDFAGYAKRTLALLEAAGATADGPVALVVRNRPVHAAVITGLIAAERSFSMVYSFQSPQAVARDIERLRPATVVADREDWMPSAVAAAERTGCVGIAVDASAGTVEYVAGLGVPGSGPFAAVPDEPSMGVLTSGTTGSPKRIQLPMRLLARSVATAGRYGGQDPRADGPPALVFWPFGGIGVAGLLGAVYAGQRVVLLERFTVEAFVDAVKRHRIEQVGVQPTVIRMLLDAAVPRGDLSSLRAVYGGSAPLDADTRERFEAAYGIPVLWAYGATEFAGTLLSWTPELYARYGRDKRHSVGKPVPGTRVRIVDPDSGAEAAAGERGYLEAHIPLVGPDWIRTMDLASVDEDGFVTLHGRGDGAIIRGGFKILPETVQRVLLSHPGVRDAVVVGVPDQRLGEVPFAAVEPSEGQPRPSAEELKALVRRELPVHHVPPRIAVLDELPRLPSLKISLRQVRELGSLTLHPPGSSPSPAPASTMPNSSKLLL